MELSTFGAIMKFAMDREREITEILEKVRNNEQFSSFRDLADRIVSDSKKNLEVLERARRENINEMILQSVTGLENSNYCFQTRSMEELAPFELGSYLGDIFDRMIRFYTDAAARISNAAASRTFSQLAREKRRLRESITECVSNLK